MASLGEAKQIQNAIDSEQDPAADDENLKEGLKQSNALHEAFVNYLRFYAARIIKQNSNQQQI